MHRLPSDKTHAELAELASTPQVRSLLETLADIAHTAGHYGHMTADSREAMSMYIAWAVEFEAAQEAYLDGTILYFGTDYMDAVDRFTREKLYEAGNCARTPQLGK